MHNRKFRKSIIEEVYRRQKQEFFSRDKIEGVLSHFFYYAFLKDSRMKYYEGMGTIIPKKHKTGPKGSYLNPKKKLKKLSKIILKFKKVL